MEVLLVIKNNLGSWKQVELCLLSFKHNSREKLILGNIRVVGGFWVKFENLPSRYAIRHDLIPRQRWHSSSVCQIHGQLLTGPFQQLHIKRMDSML